MALRGAEIPRPKPWTVKAADRQAAVGWDLLVSQALEAADRAWVAMTAILAELLIGSTSCAAASGK